MHSIAIAWLKQSKFCVSKAGEKIPCRLVGFGILSYENKDSIAYQ